MAASAAPSPAPNAANGPSTQRVELARETELRFEVPWEDTCHVCLVRGTAEIFGTEVAEGQWLAFRGGEKIAVFTWHGAVLDVKGNPEVLYVGDETPMIMYANVHGVLDARRREAAAAAPPPGDTEGSPAPQGPRVTIVGPTDSGKSSLAKILLSYAARLGWKPVYADLDLGQGAVAIPGTIGATPIEAPIDPVAGIPQDAPLVYFYGHSSPSNNPDLYKLLVRQLAAMLEKQLGGSADARAAGLIANTMGWVEGLGYELLVDSIEVLKADVVLVLGQERLASMLRTTFRGQPGVEIVQLAQPGGVVTRSTRHRQLARNMRTKEYFYGQLGELSPHSIVAGFADLKVFSIGGGPQAPKSALPIGAERTADRTRVVPVPVSRDLLHAVLAVSHAREPPELPSSNVAGFIYVTDVDVTRKKVTFVAPSPGHLPSNLLLSGSLTWVE